MASPEGGQEAVSMKMEDGGSSYLLQSNLPLLFVNGSPTSLETMTLSQLQYFPMFMLKCENGCEVTSLGDIAKPAWWPADLPFDNDLLSRRTKKGLWSRKMRYAIRECYRFNKVQFLLEFSRKLMLCTQRMDRIVTVENGDGTRSMRLASTQKLLVRFSGENQDYDKRLRLKPTNFSTHSPLKGSGCSMLVSTNNCSDPGLPQYVDLYLCENCGSDFDSLSKVLLHEKTCGQKQASKECEATRPDCPISPTTSNLSDTNNGCVDHQSANRFFHYLRLGRGSSREPVTAGSASVVRPRPSSYAKFLSIDVSSPLGKYICELGEKVPLIPIDYNLLCSNDRRGMRSAGIDGFPVTYRGPKNRRDSKRAHHVYCFSKVELQQRLQTLATGLTPTALKVYNKVKPLRPIVQLNRLKFKQNRSPKTCVKLKFNEALAAKKFLRRPPYASKGADLRPVVDKLMLPPPVLSPLPARCGRRKEEEEASTTTANEESSENESINHEVIPVLPEQRRSRNFVQQFRHLASSSPAIQCIDLCFSSDEEVSVISTVENPPLTSPKVVLSSAIMDGATHAR